MKYLLPFTIWFLCLKSYAQPAERKISFAAGSFSGKKISRDISGINILQTGSSNTTLGYIAATSGNETYRLAPEAKNNRWLDTVVTQRYSRPAGNPLTWVVRSVSVTTDTSGQYYFTHVKADVFKKAAANAWQKVLSVDTVLSGKLINNNSFTTGITDALDALYLASANRLDNKKNKNRQLSLAVPVELIIDSIELQPVKQTALPVITDNTIVRGVYASFSEFVNNKPSITEPVWAEPDMELGKGAVKLFMMNKDSSKHQLSAIWGICFGGNELYKYETGQLIPIEKSGNGFILSRYQEPAQRKNQAMYWRRMAVKGWPGDANPFDRNHAVLISNIQFAPKAKTGRQPVATCLDMETGELAF
ncbi:MAG TPA: hypothetical protein VIM79_18185 [Niastella sp.]